MDDLPDDDELQDSPGIGAKLRHSTPSREHRGLRREGQKQNNAFAKQGRILAPSADNQ